MNITCILHPTDLSACSANAFRVSCALAHDYRAHLIVLHVDHSRRQSGSRPAADFHRDRIYAQLHQIHPLDLSISIGYRLESGDAANEILRVAQDGDCDLIVMGTHTRTRLGRLLRGSVAEKVLRKADCPVLIVKTRQSEPQFLSETVPVGAREAAD